MDLHESAQLHKNSLASQLSAYLKCNDRRENQLSCCPNVIGAQTLVVFPVAHWKGGHKHECLVLMQRASARSSCLADVALDSGPIPIFHAPQPAIPDLEMVAPFSEDNLESFVGHIQCFTHLIAQYYAGPRPAGENSVTLPCVLTLCTKGGKVLPLPQITVISCLGTCVLATINCVS